jgi:hypothetical protein
MQAGRREMRFMAFPPETIWIGARCGGGTAGRKLGRRSFPARLLRIDLKI